MSGDRIIRRRYRFGGSVQGVGFRYRAKWAAHAAGVTGWVNNDWDGSVSMEVQGTTDEIEQVLAGISRGMFIQIETTQVWNIEPVEDERSFVVTDDDW